MTATLERVAIPPREQLLRMAPFALRAEGDGTGDGLTLDGYAAVFNQETIIDSWEGKFKEQIASGSMKRSFRDSPPRIQFDHGRHPLIGSIPVASVTRVAEESDPELAPDGGAHVVGRLLDNWLVQPVRDAIAARAIDGMSFRFTVVKEKWQDSDGKVIRDDETLRDLLRRTWFEEVPDDELLLRTLQELLVPELGPVVWPAYEETSVDVRSKVTIDLGHIHDDPEQKKTLARAMFHADAAERMTADEADTQDLTGRSDARSTDGGESDAESGDDASTPPTSTRVDPDGDSLRLRGILR